MGEAALRCFMCKGENTIVDASSPWPTTWRKPLVSQMHKKVIPHGGIVLYPRNGFVAPHDHGELLRGGEKVPPSIYKVKRTKTKVQII